MSLLRPSALWQTRLRGSACSLARDPAMGGRHNGAASVSDLEDRLRILDALYIPTRYPDRLPDGAPTDDFGRLQSEDALRHARSIVDAIAAALARAGAGGETRRGRASWGGAQRLLDSNGEALLPCRNPRGQRTLAKTERVAASFPQANIRLSYFDAYFRYLLCLCGFKSTDAQAPGTQLFTRPKQKLTGMQKNSIFLAIRAICRICIFSHFPPADFAKLRANASCQCPPATLLPCLPARRSP